MHTAIRDEIPEEPMRKILMLALLSATLGLAGCPKDPVEETPPADSAGTGTQEQQPEPSELEEGTQLGGQSAAERAALAERVIYFEFDSYEISPQYSAMISAHARNLASSNPIKVRLEGHTDERGSREYNIGLGERRAQSVRRALMLQGVTDPQITTVSYGEERPAVQGSDESAYAKNRRVELVYPR
jgi:peptidoglycan-associated lipoprotein